MFEFSSIHSDSLASLAFLLKVYQSLNHTEKWVFTCLSEDKKLGLINKFARNLGNWVQARSQSPKCVLAGYHEMEQ